MLLVVLQTLLRRLSVAVLQVPPFTTDLRKRAIASAQASRDPAELHVMIRSIHDKRKTLVEQLANLRVQDMLSNCSTHPTPPCIFAPSTTSQTT